MGQFASVDTTLNGEYYTDEPENNEVHEMKTNEFLTSPGTIIKECPNDYIVKFEYKLERFQRLKECCRIKNTGWDLLGYYKNPENQRGADQRKAYMDKTFYADVYATPAQYEKIKRLSFVTSVERIRLVLSPEIQESIRNHPNPIVY